MPRVRPAHQTLETHHHDGAGMASLTRASSVTRAWPKTRAVLTPVSWHLVANALIPMPVASTVVSHPPATCAAQHGTASATNRKCARVRQAPAQWISSHRSEQSVTTTFANRHRATTGDARYRSTVNAESVQATSIRSRARRIAAMYVRSRFRPSRTINDVAQRLYCSESPGLSQMSGACTRFIERIVASGSPCGDDQVCVDGACIAKGDASAELVAMSTMRSGAPSAWQISAWSTCRPSGTGCIQTRQVSCPGGGGGACPTPSQPITARRPCTCPDDVSGSTMASPISALPLVTLAAAIILS